MKIYLPRRVSPAQEVVEEKPALELPRGSGESVLVTEDDADVRAYIVQTLVELGYDVIQASDGPTALAMLSQQPVQLLLTDIVMPGMNGRVLADEACKCVPALKVLFMTGYSRNAIVHNGRLDPGVSLIQKPFSQNALAQQVRRVLSNPNDTP